MTEVVAWSGAWTIDKHTMEGNRVVTWVRSIVVASRYGIMHADFEQEDNGDWDMQSEFQPGTWGGKDPTSTFSPKLWEHDWVTKLQNKCSGTGTFVQLDPAPSGAMFKDLALHEKIMAGGVAAYELWRHWWELECQDGDRVYPYAGWPDEWGNPYDAKTDIFADLVKTGPVDHYTNDSQYGIY